MSDMTRERLSSVIKTAFTYYMNNAFREVPESLYEAESQILKLIENEKAYDKRIDEMVQHYRRLEQSPDKGVVDEEILKWVDEQILLNESKAIVEDHVCTDIAKKENRRLLRIKQLLQQKPQAEQAGVVDEAMLGQVSRLMNTCEACLDKGYGSFDDEVAFYHDVYGALCKLKQLLQSQPAVDEEMIEVLDSVIERYKLDCPSPVKVTLEALARIKQLLAQKPRVVTREEVEKGLDSLIDGGMKTTDTIEWLKELGLEVEE